MSISEESENINRVGRGGRVSLFLFGVSAILGGASFIGLGILFERVNTPVPIRIECSEEVLKGLRDQNPSKIPRVKGIGK